MKRYAVFSGENYYPCGGWSDFQGTFDTIEEARSHIATQKDQWWQIVDLQTGLLVQEK